MDDKYDHFQSESYKFKSPKKQKEWELLGIKIKEFLKLYELESYQPVHNQSRKKEIKELEVGITPPPPTHFAYNIKMGRFRLVQKCDLICQNWNLVV